MNRRKCVRGWPKSPAWPRVGGRLAAAPHQTKVIEIAIAICDSNMHARARMRADNPPTLHLVSHLYTHILVYTRIYILTY
jgi:hypothetical protein